MNVRADRGSGEGVLVMCTRGRVSSILLITVLFGEEFNDEQVEDSHDELEELRRNVLSGVFGAVVRNSFLRYSRVFCWSFFVVLRI